MNLISVKELTREVTQIEPAQTLGIVNLRHELEIA